MAWQLEEIKTYVNKYIDNPETYDVQLIYELYQLVGRRMNIKLKPNVKEDPERYKNVYLWNIDPKHYEEDEDDPDDLDKETRYILVEFSKEPKLKYIRSLYANEIESYELLD